MDSMELHRRTVRTELGARNIETGKLLIVSWKLRQPILDSALGLNHCKTLTIASVTPPVPMALMELITGIA